MVALKALYPKGAEKVIAYETCGRVIKEGQLPFQAGIIVSNVTSMAFIGEYLTTGMPLITKTLTIDGSAVREPTSSLQSALRLRTSSISAAALPRNLPSC